MAPEHGQYDPDLQKWFCGYWMSEDEWMDIHDYSPAQKQEPDGEDES